MRMKTYATALGPNRRAASFERVTPNMYAHLEKYDTPHRPATKEKRDRGAERVRESESNTLIETETDTNIWHKDLQQFKG
jgi:hypothetical protein